MDKEAGLRIAELRKELKFTQGQFAEKIGLKFSAISMIELGKAPLTEANIRLICLTFGVNEEWLRHGTGEMMDDEALLSGKEKQLLSFYRELSSQAQELVIANVEGMIKLQESQKNEGKPAGGKND